MVIRHEESAIVDTGLTRESQDVPLLEEKEIVAAARPLYPVKVGIYFLIRESTVVYVGKSVNIDARLACH